MSDEKNDSGQSLWTHEPLPYVVRVRATVNDDSVPAVLDVPVVAYSILEAMMQAIVQAGGYGMEDTRFVVESIGPNVAAYRQMLLQRYLLTGATGA